ncbi:MAG: helix-turn-helix transcriptional regulator, partial [Gammaproteobacteria bacterium]
MSAKKSASPVGKTERNPLYLKIGKRIRQARLMAKETNSRELSQRLGWSAGRIHNYETGLSTPGVDETLQFCE